MLLRLTRTDTIGNSVLGVLTENGNKICDTLENKPCLIPELIYRVQVTRSPKFQRLLPEICQVPNRSGIRIHAGNTAKDSAGCILVGTREGNTLRDSRKTETELTQMLNLIQKNHEEIRIEITHFVPEYEGYPRVDCRHGYGVTSAIELQGASGDGECE